MYTNIRWTDRERNVVVRKYAEMVYAGADENLATFRRAQTAAIEDGKLAQDRFRNVSSVQSIGLWFTDLVISHLDAISLEAQEQALSADAVAAVVEPEQPVFVNPLADNSTDSLISELLRRGLSGALSDGAVLSPIVGQIAAKLEPSIVTALTSKILEVLPSMLSGAVNSITVSSPTAQVSCKTKASAKKRKIVVIGLKGGQPQQVKDRVSEDLAITFYESRVTASQLKSTLKYTDYVFFMSDWNNHSTQAVVKNSHVPFEYVPGTVTNLINRIKEVSTCE